MAIRTEVQSMSCFVRGAPVTKGSLRQWHRFVPDGRCVMGLSEQNGPRLAEWRALIATAAKRAMHGAPPFSGPVCVVLSFYFRREGKQTFDRGLQPFVYGNKKWDIDKLARACLDALTDSAIWQDDSQVAVLVAEKRYADAGSPPGVRITIEPTTEADE